MSAVRLLPWVVHESIEYLAGIFMVLAPFIFGLREEPVFPLFLIVGVVILAVAVLSPGPAGVVGLLPVAAHAVLDYILAFFLLVAPFVLGFTELDVALYLSVFLGLAHLVITLVTSFPQPEGETAAQD